MSARRRIPNEYGGRSVFSATCAKEGSMRTAKRVRSDPRTHPTLPLALTSGHVVWGQNRSEMVEGGTAEGAYLLNTRSFSEIFGCDLI